MDTNVSVKGKSTFLVDLQEDDLKNMNDTEHDEFERKQTQIFVGFQCGDKHAPPPKKKTGNSGDTSTEKEFRKREKGNQLWLFPFAFRLDH